MAEGGRSGGQGGCDRDPGAGQRKGARPRDGPGGASEEQIKAAALGSEQVQKYLEGKEPKKVIVVQERLVSIVV